MRDKPNSNYETYNKETQTWEFDPDKAEAAWNKDAYIDDDGVIVRWKGNDSVPPRDCLYAFLLIGKIDESQFKVCCEERAFEAEESLKAYKEARAKHGISEEELFEMRAAFGEGAEVIDILTGQKIKL